MKKEKICAILYYVAAVCFCLVAAIKFLSSDDTSMGVVWLCLGSTMLCLGSVWLNKMKKKDEEEKKKSLFGGLAMSRKNARSKNAMGYSLTWNVKQCKNLKL